MSIEAKLGNLTPLPGYLLYPDSKDKAEAYDKLPSDQAKFDEGGKWWSMYDLMDYFHSGIMPEHSKSNYFEFEIDFTSPHLKVASISDPNMVQELNSTMTTGLQSLASNVQNLISKLQVEASNKTLDISTGALLTNRRGGTTKRKLKRGGDGELAGQPPAAGLGTADQITALLSPANLEIECLKDIFRVKLNTWDRIFITNAKKNALPLSSILNLPKEENIIDQVKAATGATGATAATAATAAPAAGGAKTRRRKHANRRKTNKHKTNKHKTNRRRHK
jgi:hypothetical protein